MKTVSFQGVQLSAGQRRQQAFQQQVRTSFLSAPLRETIDQALAAAETAKPQRIWFVERQESGAPCLAEWMGY